MQNKINAFRKENTQNSPISVSIVNCFQLHHTQVTYIESRKSSLCENEFEIYVEVEVTPSICSLATLVETLKAKVNSINLIRTYNQIDKLKKFTSLDRGDTKCKNNSFLCNNTLMS